jgi:hypothetical protein
MSLRIWEEKAADGGDLGMPFPIRRSLTFQDDNAKKVYSNGSFGSHHLGLESKNLLTILSITYLAITELIMKFYGFSSHV